MVFHAGGGNEKLVYLPGESHGQRSLAGYSPWGHTELDMTEVTNTHTHTHTECDEIRDPAATVHPLLWTPALGMNEAGGCSGQYQAWPAGAGPGAPLFLLRLSCTQGCDRFFGTSNLESRSVVFDPL